MRAKHLVIASIMVIACAATVQAQKAFVPESLTPRTPGEFGVPSFDNAYLLFNLPAPSEELWAVDMISGISLRRSVKVTPQDLFGYRTTDTPFFYLFRHEETTELTSAVGERTRFSYARQLQRDADVLDRVRSYGEYRGYGLEQVMGGGRSALTLGFRRGVREVQAPGAATPMRTAEEAYSLAGGLGGLGNITLGFSSSRPLSDGGAETQALQAALARAFSGGEGKFVFSRNLLQQGEYLQADYKSDVLLPLAVRGGVASFAYQRQAQVKGGVETSSRQATFRTPLAFWGTGASLAWQLTGNVKDNAETEQRTTTAVLPLRLFDRSFGNTFVDERLSAGGQMTRRQAWLGEVPFEKTQIKLGYSHVQPYSASGERGQRQRIETVQIPSLRVFTDRLHADFTQTRTETVGGASVRVTQVNGEARPLDNLTIAAQLQEQDKGPGNSSQTTQVRSDLALSRQLSLNWRYLEQQQVGLSPHIERCVGVEQKIDGHLPVQMRIGYTSYETPEDEPRESAYGAQVALGQADKTNLTATYMQFDEKELTRLNEDVVRFALTQRFGNALALRTEYEDQPGRIAPMRAVLLQAPAFGGDLTLALRSNPVDPRNQKVVRQADQWDAELKRRLGTLDVVLSYRYCEYEREQNQVEQYLRLAIAGGKPEGGGQLSLAYATGDFAPTPPTSDQPLPGSVLELRYQKNWSTAQLSLSLRRATAPWGDIQGEDHAEGRLELKALW